MLVKSNQKTEYLIEDLEKIPTVEFTEPNYYVEMYTVPEGSYYNYQWGLQNQMETQWAVDANIAEVWDKAPSSVSDVPIEHTVLVLSQPSGTTKKTALA